jgi:hypothetical protein
VKRGLLVMALLAQGAQAADKPVLTYKPPADEERPLIAEVHAAPQGSDFALEVRFNKVPWGEDCRNRCANATLFLDMDNNPKTGLQLGKALETGADLAITVQGAREYLELGARSYVRLRVRQLSSGNTSVDDGDVVAEFDHRKDPERLQVDGDTIFALVDATLMTLPSGRLTRVVYHPPGDKAVEGTTRGMLAAQSGRQVDIFRKGKQERKPGRKKAAQQGP